MPVGRQFSHWPCRTLSWTRSLVGLVGVQYDAPGSLGSTRSGHRATAADAALKRWSSWTSACSFLASAAPIPPAVTQPVRYFSIGCVAPQSPPIHISKRVCRRNRARMGQGAGASSRGAAARRADAACLMTRSQDGAADWSIGSGGHEEGGTDADFQGQRKSGQQATGKTRHAINVTVTVTPPARKVVSRGGRISRRLLHLRVLRGTKRTQAGGRAEPFFSLALS
jgi:hypothetical protein